ncbi:MAG: hypothetical protein AABY27_00480, partial [Pseudomonadota bacterium]
ARDRIRDRGFSGIFTDEIKYASKTLAEEITKETKPVADLLNAARDGIIKVKKAIVSSETDKIIDLDKEITNLETTTNPENTLTQADEQTSNKNPTHNQYYRSDQEYTALQNKGIIVNRDMSYSDDAIDGKFLSKLDPYEYYIDASRGKVIVSLGQDSNGNAVFKEYDLTRANDLRKSYGNIFTDGI